MDEEKKEPVREELKSSWQIQKESWYDKIPLTVKQLDIIIGVCLTLLGLIFGGIALDVMGICNIF